MWIKPELSGVQELLKKLDPKEHTIMARRALNKLLPRLKTLADNSIRNRYNVKKKDLGIKVKKATKNPIGFLGGAKRYLSLTKFPHKQTKQGVIARIRKGGQGELKDRAFIATMKTGHKGVFYRMFKAGKERYPRLPVKEVYGPAPGALLKSEETKKVIQGGMRDLFPELLGHELKRHFEKKK